MHYSFDFRDELRARCANYAKKNCGVCVETENVRQNTTEIVIKKSLHHKRKLLINFHLLWFLFPLYRCCYYE